MTFILIPPSMSSVTKTTQARPHAGQPLRGALAAVLSALLLLLLACGLASCQAGNSKVVWHDESRQIQGTFAAGQPPEVYKNLVVYVLDGDGERSPAKNLSTDTKDSSYRFIMDHKQLVPRPFRSAADDMLAMGDDGLLPVRSERYLAEARFEFLSGNMPDPSGEVSYTRVYLPLTRSDLWGSGRQLQVSSELRLETVAYQRLHVKNAAGQALAGAAVIGVVPGQGVAPERGLVPAWTHDLYRPVIDRSNERGEALLVPLKLPSEAASYAVVVSAPGYCTYASPAVPLRTGNGVHEVGLEACQPKPAGSSGLLVSFAPEHTTFAETVEGEEKEMAVAYVNSTAVKVRVLAPEGALPNLSLRVWEGMSREPSASMILDDAALKRSASNGLAYQSDLEVVLPARFQSGDSLDGDFTIEVSVMPQPSATHSAASERFYLYGHKKSAPPPDAFLDDLTIMSAETAGVISGEATASLFMTTSFCSEGMALGIKFNEDAVFAPCQAGGKAEFKVGDLGLAHTAPFLGGLVKARVYLRDKFLNTSRDDVLSRNEVSLFVDYSRPDLKHAPLVLGRDFGFAPKGSAAGREGSIYDFSEHMVTVLTPQNAANYVLRFAAPGQCATKQGDKGDGVVYGKQGLGISGYAIAGQSGQAPAAKFLSCASGGSAVDWPLVAGDIEFPTDGEGAALFYLTVKDLAGNVSDAALYEIPACSGASAASYVCWQQ